MRTLVVAAYAPELGKLPGRAIGIGLVGAALGVARALDEERPDRLLFVGTAGALPGSDLAVGSVVVAVAARLIVRAHEYLPRTARTEVVADARFAGECARALAAPQVTVVSGLGITSSDEEARRLSSIASVEHLETFAVLLAAAAKLPATAILTIANRVGERAHDEWKANRAAAEAAGQAAVARLLGA